MQFARDRNNALPGLKAEDKWCICAGWYAKAAAAGKAPPIDIDATHKEALQWPAVAKALELSLATRFLGLVAHFFDGLLVLIPKRHKKK